MPAEQYGNQEVSSTISTSRVEKEKGSPRKRTGLLYTVLSIQHVEKWTCHACACAAAASYSRLSSGSFPMSDERCPRTATIIICIILSLRFFTPPYDPCLQPFVLLSISVPLHASIFPPPPCDPFPQSFALVSHFFPFLSILQWWFSASRRIFSCNMAAFSLQKRVSSCDEPFVFMTLFLRSKGRRNSVGLARDNYSLSVPRST